MIPPLEENIPKRGEGKRKEKELQTNTVGSKIQSIQFHVDPITRHTDPNQKIKEEKTVDKKRERERMQDKNSNQPCVKVKGQRTSTESVDNRDDLDRSEDSRMEIFQWLEKLNMRSDLI